MAHLKYFMVDPLSSFIFEMWYLSFNCLYNGCLAQRNFVYKNGILLSTPTLP